MLALLFRGVFLAGVIGWYSTSLWRMIDGYFKDQFQRYLEEEYQRNPKMREDVRVYAAVDKSGNPTTDAPTKETQGILESCGLDVDENKLCTVGEADHDETAGNESVPPLVDAFGAGAAEKEVDGLPENREPAFHEDAEAEPPDERVNEETADLEYNVSQHSIILEETKQLPHTELEIKNEEESQLQQENLQTAAQCKQQQSEFEHKEEEQQPELQEKHKQQSELQQERHEQKPQVRKKRRSSGRPQIGAPSETAAKRKKKRYEKIQMLTLNDGGSDTATRKRRFMDEHEEEDDDRDFSEFDDEDNQVPSGKASDDDTGVPVADLPFKPVIDIYDLEKVSGEEFCPLTLEDDPSCEETRTWP